MSENQTAPNEVSPTLIQAASDSGVMHYRFVPVLGRSNPSLAPVAWRLVKASERLQQLDDLAPQVAAAWRGEHPTLRAKRSSPDTIELSVPKLHGQPEAELRELAMIASEILNHVRIALDYLAFNVVWMDSGSKREDTKFPLHTRSTGYGEVRRKAMPRITTTHAEWVKAVQPFNGVAWTSHLEELSNRDKHRLAVDVVAAYTFSVDHAHKYADPLGDPAYLGYQVNDPTLALLLADPMLADANQARLELMPTLTDILGGSAKFVNQFLAEAGLSEMTITSSEIAIEGAGPAGDVSEEA